MSVVKMKKITLLTRWQDADNIIISIRDSGLMHINKFNNVNETNKKYNEYLEKNISKFKKSNDILNHIDDELLINTSKKKSNLINIVDEILSHFDNKISILKKLDILKSDLMKLEKWGDFDYKDIVNFKNINVIFNFYIFERNNWEEFDKKNINFFIINKDEKHYYIVIINNDDDLQKFPKPILLPNFSRTSLLSLKLKLLSELAIEEKSISCFVQYRENINKKLDEFIQEKSFERIKSISIKKASLFIIDGFVPINRLVEFCDKIKKEIVSIMITDPLENDEVPIKLKNNKIFQAFESILHTFSGVNYREKDTTWCVGILFVIFGSLCFLDAGYSILLMLTGSLLKLKKKDSISKVFMITGFISAIIGALGGQIFGLILGKDFLINVNPIINLAVDPLACFIFSLIVGLLSMGFSYSIAIWQRGLKTSATGGLFLVFSITSFIISNFVINDIDDNRNLMLKNKDIFDIIAYFLLFSTVLFWFIFPEKVFGESRIPNIIWTIYSGVTGLMQDILSHMRLFGIALSGAILALVVNKIAFMLPFVVTVIFAFIGHLFVFLLALLSLYIHTNRLIFLEFGSKCIIGGHHIYLPFNRSSHL